MKQTEISKARGWWKHLLLLCVTLLGVVGIVTAGTPNYPFPQNYKYPYGNIYTGSNVQSKIQSLYTTWLGKYYTEGTCKGQQCARIKFVQDGESGTNTVSEGIAYGMLIFVFMDNATNNTQDKFDRLWRYYQANANGNGFMNWKVNAFTGNVTSGSGNANGATDADVDVAQALMLAHKQWGSEGAINYKEAAEGMIARIWTHEVDQSAKVLKPGDAFNDYDNPCYFITNALELFKQFDKTHDWTSIINGCYSLMGKVANGSTGLIPDWCYSDGRLLSGLIDGKFESIFGYDAVRIPWRLAHAYAWFGHEQAYNMASKITTWSQSKCGGNPASLKDGYTLAGQEGTGGLGGSLRSWGTSTNACFSSGLSIGAMVDSKFSSYMDQCWAVGNTSDPYGAYYTHTTQLLYMLCLTGNMPNFYDMLPVYESAETNSDGTKIYLNWTKALKTNGVSGSPSYFTVKTYENAEDNTAEEISVKSVQRDNSNNKQLILTLNKEISEPVITISYNGTILVANDDGAVASEFEDKPVTNLITSMEPYPIARYTDLYGTIVYVQWSKPINADGASASDFTVKVNGSPYTPATIKRNEEDWSVLELNMGESIVPSSSAEVTVSYTPSGKITSTEGTKGARAFSNAVVQNYYMTQTCYTLLEGDVNPFAVAAGWAGAGLTWTTNVDLPGGGKGYKFSENGSAGGYISARGAIPDGDYSGFEEYFFTNKVTVKGRIYVTANPNSESLTLRFCYTPDKKDEWVWETARNIEFSAAEMGKNTWFEFERTVTSPDPSVTYNGFMMFSSKTQAATGTGALEYYIDYLELCPPAPVVEPLYGRVSYDGYQVELHFSTAMRVPDIYSVVITEDGVEKEIVAAATKTGDAASVIYTLAQPISSPSTTVLASKGGTLKAADGRSAEEFSDFVVCNTAQMSVSTGWYDDFNDANDYVTKNVGGDQKAVAFEEVVANEGKLAVEFKGVKAWAGPTIQTYSAGYDGYVMDLTGNEKVSFRAKLASGSSKTYKMRISMKDYINERASDGGGVWEDITFTNSYQTYNFDLGAKMYAQYGNDPGDVDRTNIYQVLIYIVETVSGDGATITLPSTTIDFDWIKIGNPLILNVSPSRAMITVTEGNRDVAGVDENSTIQCTSSADGYIYVVPGDTPPQFSALEDSVVAGKGVKVACTAETQTNVSLDGIGWGFYYAYAYDPVVGALSTKVPVNIKDVTPPEIISVVGPTDEGKIGAKSTISVLSNETGTLYVVESSDASSIHEWADLVDADKWSMACVGGVPLEVPVDAIAGSAIGKSYVCFVMDNSTNISLPSDVITVAPVDLDIVDLTLADADLGYVTGNNITVTVTRPCDVFLVLASKDVDAATLDDPSVYTLKVEKNEPMISYTLETGSIAEGAYYVYLLDGDELAGPSGRLELAAGNVPVSAISVSKTDQGVVNVGDSKAVTITVLPTNASNKALTATAEGGNATFEYRNEEGVCYIDVTGVKSSAGQPVHVTVSAVNIEEGGSPVTCEFDIQVFQAPTGITIEGASSMVVGGTQTLTATIEPADADDTEVEWSLVGPASMLQYIASIDAEGKVTAIDETEDPITVKAVCKNYPDIENTFEITIGAQLITSITPTPATVTVAQGGVANVVVAIEPGDASDKTIDVTYSKENIASAVYADGTLTITGVAVGTTNVILTNAKSGKSASVAVTVTCPTEAPTSADVDQLQTICQGTATALTTKTDFTAVWYESATGGEPLQATPATTVGTEAASYTYYVAKVDGCESAERLEVTMLVTAKPTAKIKNEDLEFCETTTEVALTAEISTNATWTATLDGNDVTADVISGTTFNPSAKGAGEYTITLSRGTAECGETDSKTFTVTAAPEVTVTVPDEICGNADPITLQASETGGTWSGTGVSEGTFNPAGGTSEITYTYTSGACEVKVVETFKVTPTPNPTIDGLKTAFCKNAEAISFSKLGVSPANGTFSIDGEAAESFDPSTLDAGEHTVSYTVANGGCSGSKNVVVTVNNIPEVVFGDYSNEMCDNADAQTLTATPENGTWSANTNAGVFNPHGFDGDVTVTYTVTDANECKNSKDATIKVTKTVAPELEKSVYGIVVGAAVPELSATGDAIKWYATEDGDAVEGATYTPAMTADEEKTVTVYVTNTVDGCESNKEAVTITVTDCQTEPVAIEEVDAICFGQTIPALVATGDGASEIRWYNAKGEKVSTGASFTPGNDVITSSGSYRFYAAQYSEANACEGIQTAVTLTVKNTPAAPSLTENASCAGAALNKLISSDAAFWYSAEEAGAALTETASNAYTPEGLEETATFYARTELNGCYSAFVPVTYTINPAPAAPEVEATSACIGSTDDYVVKANAADGCTLQWYDNHDNALGNDATQNVTGVTQAGEYVYTVKQRSAQNCASAAANATLTVNALPTPKITLTETEYCSSFTEAINLTAEPDPSTGLGGVFKVNDVVTTSFTPNSYDNNSVLTINYEFTDANGCKANASAKNVTIVDCNDSPVTAMQVVPSAITLKSKGATSDKLKVIITTEKEGAYNQAVSWESSNPDVATVADGVVTAVGVGEATVKALSTYTIGQYAECAVTVIFPVTSVSFSQESISLGSGQSKDLKELVSFEPAEAVVTYEWTAGAGLTVEDGMVTANETATDITSNVMVTVKTADGTSKSATIPVNVTAQVVLVSSITLKEGDALTLQEGATYTMGKPTVSDATDKSFTWSIEGSGAEITAEGVVTVTGKAGDTFKVVATANDGSGTKGECTVTISDKVIPISSVTFKQDGVYEIFASEPINMSELIVIEPEDATYTTIEWTVNNYGTIDENGVFTPNAETINNQGLTRQPVISATVRATDGKSTKASQQVIVHPDPTYVTSITIPETVSVEQGDTYTFEKSSVKVMPLNAEDRTYTWSIKTEGAPATIDADGVITLTEDAVPGDNFIVIATANDLKAAESNECLVTVLQKTIKLTGITVDKSELQLEAGSMPQVVYVTLKPEETTQTNYEIIVSDNATDAIVVTDNKDGSFDVVGVAGVEDAKVTVRSIDNPAISTTITVTVKEYVKSIKVKGSQQMYVGNTVNLSVEVGDATASDKTVKWSSSDETVATVSQNGVVLGKGPGMVQITATANDGSGVSNYIDISVDKIAVESLAAKDITIEIGQTATVKTTISPANATYQDLSYFIADNDIATIDGDGVVTGIKDGTTQLTISAMADQVQTTIIIKVTLNRANKETLIRLIEDEVWGAYSVYNKVESGDIVIGWGKGQITPLKYNEFQNAWMDAQTVRYEEFATQEAVNNAEKRLLNAIKEMGIVIDEDLVPDAIDDVVVINAKVYPSIVTNTVTVEADNLKAVKIVSVAGKVVAQEEVAGDEIEINASKFAQGTYKVIIETEDGVTTGSFIKK